MPCFKVLRFAEASEIRSARAEGAKPRRPKFMGLDSSFAGLFLRKLSSVAILGSPSTDLPAGAGQACALARLRTPQARGAKPSRDSTCRGRRKQKNAVSLPRAQRRGKRSQGTPLAREAHEWTGRQRLARAAKGSMVTERGVHFAHFLRHSAAWAAASPMDTCLLTTKKKMQYPPARTAL